MKTKEDKSTEQIEAPVEIEQLAERIRTLIREAGFVITESSVKTMETVMSPEVITTYSGYGRISFSIMKPS